MEGDSRLLQRGVTSGDVADLLDVLKDLSSDWDLFMIQLVPGVQGEVDAIKTNRAGHGNYCQKCLSDGLNHFVKTSTKPTYDDIHKVLRRPSMKNAPVADKLLEHLREKYNGDVDQSDNGRPQRDGGSQEQQQSPNQQCNMFRKWLWPAVLVVVALAVALYLARFSVPYGDVIPKACYLTQHSEDIAAIRTRRPMNYELLLMHWKDPSTGAEREFRLKEEIVGSCKKIGTTFGIRDAVLSAVCTDPEECCDEVLLRWSQGSIPRREEFPVQWGGLIDALHQNCPQVADDLQNALIRRL